MRKTLLPAFLLALGSVLLGATVFHEPLARAATTVSARIVAPLDAGGNVKVHEQGTVQVDAVSTPARRFVTATARLSLTGSTGPAAQTDIYTIPAGKVLVIQYVNGLEMVPSGQSGGLVQLTDQNSLSGQGPNNFWTFDANKQGTVNASPSDIYAISNAVQIYAPGGQTLAVNLRGSDIGTQLTLTIFGYLVDAP